LFGVFGVLLDVFVCEITKNNKIYSTRSPRRAMAKKAAEEQKPFANWVYKQLATCKLIT
jgi:hypothetical protein